MADTKTNTGYAAFIAHQALKYMQEDNDIPDDVVSIIAANFATMLNHCNITPLAAKDDYPTQALIESVTFYLFADAAGVYEDTYDYDCAQHAADFAASCLIEAASHFKIRLNSDDYSRSFIGQLCIAISRDSNKPEIEFEHLKNAGIITDNDIRRTFTDDAARRFLHRDTQAVSNDKQMQDMSSEHTGQTISPTATSIGSRTDSENEPDDESCFMPGEIVMRADNWDFDTENPRYIKNNLHYAVIQSIDYSKNTAVLIELKDSNNRPLYFASNQTITASINHNTLLVFDDYGQLRYDYEHICNICGCTDDYHDWH